MYRALLRKTRMCSKCAPNRRLALDRASYFRPLCLPLTISRYSFHLLWILLQTLAPPFNLRVALECTSVSKAFALASDHAAVCYLLILVLSDLQGHFFTRPPSALNVDQSCAQTPSETGVGDKGADSGRASPLPTRHKIPPPKLLPSTVQEDAFDEAPPPRCMKQM